MELGLTIQRQEKTLTVNWRTSRRRRWRRWGSGPGRKPRSPGARSSRVGGPRGPDPGPSWYPDSGSSRSSSRPTSWLENFVSGMKTKKPFFRFERKQIFHSVFFQSVSFRVRATFIRERQIQFSLAPGFYIRLNNWCIAHRKHTCFSPNSPGFDSRCSTEFFTWWCWDLLTALLRTADWGLIMSKLI